MGLRINTNVQSLVAQRNLGINHEAQKGSLEKLSSGSRINHAADDAAGMAISEKMKAQIRSIRQDVRNANDAISLVQTAEGGINEIGNILVRFRELAIQSSTDTVSDTERGFIDKEIQQLKQEVDRIASSTEFNGRQLLNGEGQLVEFQVGQFNRPGIDRFTYDSSRINVTQKQLGVEGLSLASKEQSQNSLDVIDKAMMQVVESRAELGAFQNRLQSSVNNLQIYDENLSAAKSRISDVDMASETAELTKHNILTSAGTSVLSQANSNGLTALKLLG